MSLISVLVATAVLGIGVMAMSQAFGNLIDAQRIAKLEGQAQDIRTILRGSVSCATRCADVLADLPKIIGEWEIRAKCGEGDHVLAEMRNLKLRDAWMKVFKDDAADAICSKSIERVAGDRIAQEGEPKSRRRLCPEGSVLLSVDFEAETIACR